MNKINHKPAQDIICDIAIRIDKQIKAALTYKEKKVALEGDTRLSTEYREGQIRTINDAYLKELQETRAFLVEKLEAVGTIEEELENILDFDIPELSETLAALNTTQGKLPKEVIAGIRDKFKDNYQVMLTLAAALENQGYKLEDFGFDYYIHPASLILAQMIDNASNIETSADSSFISLRDLFNAVIDFGEKRGMVFGETIKKLDERVADVISDYLVHEAMGLPQR